MKSNSDKENNIPLNESLFMSAKRRLWECEKVTGDCDKCPCYKQCRALFDRFCDKQEVTRADYLKFVQEFDAMVHSAVFATALQTMTKVSGKP